METRELLALLLAQPTRRAIIKVLRRERIKRRWRLNSTVLVLRGSG